MKSGDLVRMKPAMFWTLKANPGIIFTTDVATVISAGTHIMEVMWPNMRIVRIDKDLFEVIENA
ncbi:MAG TPA: hypothetical protein EYQ00_08405 [Dehalococcoidia bacterium]|nr:hypothetical protein [Dehalococcoidia bacterium]